MMAPDRYPRREYEFSGGQIVRGRPAPVLSARMSARREEVARQQLRRGMAQLGARVAMAALAAALLVLCGMLIYQGFKATDNSRRISALKEELHELTMDAEAYECTIAEAAARDRIEAGANRLGMSYPDASQVRTMYAN